eukprot:TRINITY_DN11939_c0_g1_i1.p1 TRINITY_DN11939_c0_g1~~TRINITY_DN11939_c0_g1_i1.p1  ORF type:complete len:473 (+),score=68.36 TRINITY_DN11939_c0_g1_i1:114-1532(+)
MWPGMPVPSSSSSFFPESSGCPALPLPFPQASATSLPFSESALHFKGAELHLPSNLASMPSKRLLGGDFNHMPQKQPRVSTAEGRSVLGPAERHFVQQQLQALEATLPPSALGDYITTQPQPALPSESAISHNFLPSAASLLSSLPRAPQIPQGSSISQLNALASLASVAASAPPVSSSVTPPNLLALLGGCGPNVPHSAMADCSRAVSHTSSTPSRGSMVSQCLVPTGPALRPADAPSKSQFFDDRQILLAHVKKDPSPSSPAEDDAAWRLVFAVGPDAHVYKDTRIPISMSLVCIPGKRRPLPRQVMLNLTLEDEGGKSSNYVLKGSKHGEAIMPQQDFQVNLGPDDLYEVYNVRVREVSRNRANTPFKFVATLPEHPEVAPARSQLFFVKSLRSRAPSYTKQVEKLRERRRKMRLERARSDEDGTLSQHEGDLVAAGTETGIQEEQQTEEVAEQDDGRNLIGNAVVLQN